MATVKLLSGILRHVLLLVVGVQGVLRSPVSNSIYPSVFAGARRLPTASLSSPINGLSLKASDVLSAEEAISQDQLARALSEAQDGSTLPPEAHTVPIKLEEKNTLGAGPDVLLLVQREHIYNFVPTAYPQTFTLTATEAQTHVMQDDSSLPPVAPAVPVATDSTHDPLPPTVPTSQALVDEPDSIPVGSPSRSENVPNPVTSPSQITEEEAARKRKTSIIAVVVIVVVVGFAVLLFCVCRSHDCCFSCSFDCELDCDSLHTHRPMRHMKPVRYSRPFKSDNGASFSVRINR